RQQDDEDHAQRHRESGERAPVAEPSQQAAIDRPARKAQDHRPEQRGHERPQDNQAAGQQNQQDDPAQVLFQFRAQRVHVVFNGFSFFKSAKVSASEISRWMGPTSLSSPSARRMSRWVAWASTTSSSMFIIFSSSYSRASMRTPARSR